MNYLLKSEPYSGSGTAGSFVLCRFYAAFEAAPDKIKNRTRFHKSKKMHTEQRNVFILNPASPIFHLVRFAIGSSIQLLFCRAFYTDFLNEGARRYRIEHILQRTA